jgi:uncharacterized membrane protein
MINSTKLINSTKTMILMALLATLMVASLAAPAIAKEKNHNNGSNETAPLKDKGITSCDLTPSSSGCKSTSEPAVDSSNNAPKDQGKNSCEFSFAKCDSSTQSTNDSENCKFSFASCDTSTQSPTDPENCKFSFARCDSSTQSATDPEQNPVKDSAANTSNSDKDKPLKDPGIRQCDLTPPGCSASDNSDNKDGQTANSGTVYGCPYNYDYKDELDGCFPSNEDLGFYSVLNGDKPFPTTLGGGIGFGLSLPGDMLQVLGSGLDGGLDYLGDTLADFGEGGGPIGWGIQGLGYTIGFSGDAAGAIMEGAGQVANAVADGAGDVVDAIGGAAQGAVDEIGSWF